jgi:hypothetical protein
LAEPLPQKRHSAAIFGLTVPPSLALADEVIE